jgi:flavin reductase (DIM6/NTAB) family NADH-FMN oxidoreductase RutF
MSPVPRAGRGDAPPTEAERLRRRVLWTMPTGLYLVGSGHGSRVNLMTANWVMQVATDPVLVAVAVEHDAVTAALVADGGAFAVSILDRADRSVVRRFVKPVTDVARDQSGRLAALAGEAVVEVGGLPVLARALAFLRCEVRHRVEWDAAGPGGGSRASHLMFAGEVVEAGFGPGRPEGGEGVAGADASGEVLRMEDTRMHYGG